VTDDELNSTVVEEPSPEDFDAAEEEESPAGPWAIVLRILRIVAVLIVIAALLVYFVAPYGRFLGLTRYRWIPHGIRIQPIPRAPAPAGSPTLPV